MQPHMEVSLAVVVETISPELPKFSCSGDDLLATSDSLARDRAINQTWITESQVVEILQVDHAPAIVDVLESTAASKDDIIFKENVP